MIGVLAFSRRFQMELTNRTVAVRLPPRLFTVGNEPKSGKIHRFYGRPAACYANEQTTYKTPSESRLGRQTTAPWPSPYGAILASVQSTSVRRGFGPEWPALLAEPSTAARYELTAVLRCGTKHLWNQSVTDISTIAQEFREWLGATHPLAQRATVTM